MTDLIFRLFGERIKRKLSEGYFKPQTLADLTFAYTGPDGSAYYTWQDVSEMPAVRIKRIEGMLLWADAGLNAARLTEIAGMTEQAIMDGLKARNDEQRSKALARATKINGELMTRSSQVIPEEIYYELAALTICRTDEDPTGIDPDIHEKKKTMLRDAGKAGASFFASMPAFRNVLRASLTTVEGLGELLVRWSAEALLWQAKRGVYTSARGSQSTARTSTSSPSASPVEPSPSSQGS